MKVKESFWHEAAKADKNDRPSSTKDSVRGHQSTIEQTNAANRTRQSDSPLKEESKFADFLESPAKTQKPSQKQEGSSEQHGEERKKDKKHVAGEKDAGEVRGANDDRTEKRESFGGQTGGGNQNGFGTGAQIDQLNLSENFAARSILHIADLERLVSTVRSQINLGGRREIVLQLKRSVLDGLQVKITTDPSARVAVEFIAANEAVRSQINGHSEELAGILRGRGINLQSLNASLDTNHGNQDSTGENTEPVKLDSVARGGKLNDEENTFNATPPETDDKIYQA